MADKKLNFYSGGALQNLFIEDVIVRDYMKGEYRKRVNGITYAPEKIPEGVTKYNVEFVRRVNACLEGFLSYIALDGCIEALLQEHSNKNEVYGAIRNIYNMMRAQGGTVRYLRSLRSSLKKYQVRHKVVYDALNKDMEKTEERMVRNRSFIIELYNEYGFHSLIEYLESKGTDIFEDAEKKIAELRTIEYPYEKFNDIDAQYKAIYQGYVDYIKDLAKKEGLTLFQDVTASTITHNIARREKAAEVAEIRKKAKQEKQFENVKARVSEDNTDLFKLIESGTDYYLATHLVPRLELIGGEGFYIVTRKKSQIYYVNSDKQLSTSRSTMLLFAKDNKTEAEKVKEQISEENPRFDFFIMEIGLPKMYMRDIVDKGVIKRADTIGVGGNQKLLTAEDIMDKSLIGVYSTHISYVDMVLIEEKMTKGRLCYIAYYYKGAVRYYIEGSKYGLETHLGKATLLRVDDPSIPTVIDTLKKQFSLKDSDIKVTELKSDFAAYKQEIEVINKQEKANTEKSSPLLKGKYYIMTLYPGNRVRYLVSTSAITDNTTDKLHKAVQFNTKEEAEYFINKHPMFFNNRLVKVGAF